MTIAERCSAITGCKLYLMDLTSTFTALVPRDEGDTEEMTHTNTQAWKDLEAHIFIQRTRLATHTPDAHVCVQNSITHLLILHRDI